MDIQAAISGLGNITIPSSAGLNTAIGYDASVTIGTVPNYEVNTIRGKLLKAEIKSDMVHLEDAADPKLFEEQIKLQLCQKIAEEMYTSGMIQWMKQPSDHSNSYMNYRGYAYIVPSEDVQVIRTLIK